MFARVGFRTAVFALLGRCARSFETVQCPDGTTVASIDVWHGYWVDRLVANCTDGSATDWLPNSFADGGSETQGVCAGSGSDVEGVESIAWYSSPTLTALADRQPVVYLNVTCRNGDSFIFADDVSFDTWFPDGEGDRTVDSCDDGESVTGLSADVEYFDSDDSATKDYAITGINLVCSSLPFTPAPVVVERPSTSSPSSSSSSSSSVPLGAVIGGSVGGAVLLLLAAVFVAKRRRDSKGSGGPDAPEAGHVSAASHGGGKNYPVSRILAVENNNYPVVSGGGI